MQHVFLQHHFPFILASLLGRYRLESHRKTIHTWWLFFLYPLKLAWSPQASTIVQYQTGWRRFKTFNFAYEGRDPLNKRLFRINESCYTYSDLKCFLSGSGTIKLLWFRVLPRIKRAPHELDFTGRQMLVKDQRTGNNEAKFSIAVRVSVAMLYVASEIREKQTGDKDWKHPLKYDFHKNGISMSKAIHSISS